MSWTIQREAELRAGSEHKNVNSLKILRNLRGGHQEHRRTYNWEVNSGI